jgi:hypothetical protein
MSPAKKAVPAAAKQPEPAKETTPVPDTTPQATEPTQPAEEPAEPTVEAEAGETEGSDFCPTPGECFPDGIADHVSHVGCVHGQWDLTE